MKTRYKQAHNIESAFSCELSKSSHRQNMASRKRSPSTPLHIDLAAKYRKLGEVEPEARKVKKKLAEQQALKVPMEVKANPFTWPRSKKLAEKAKKCCEAVAIEQWQRELRQHSIANNYRKQYGHMHTKKPDHMPSSGQSGYLRSDKMDRIARSKPAPRTYPASSKEQINMLQILVTSLMAGPPVDRRDLIRELEKINNRLTTLKSNPTWGFEPLTNTQRAWLNHETPPMPDNEMA